MTYTRERTLTEQHTESTTTQTQCADALSYNCISLSWALIPGSGGVAGDERFAARTVSDSPQQTSGGMARTQPLLPAHTLPLWNQKHCEFVCVCVCAYVCVRLLPITIKNQNHCEFVCMLVRVCLLCVQACVCVCVCLFVAYHYQKSKPVVNTHPTTMKSKTLWVCVCVCVCLLPTTIKNQKHCLVNTHPTTIKSKTLCLVNTHPTTIKP